MPHDSLHNEHLATLVDAQLLSHAPKDRRGKPLLVTRPDDKRVYSTLKKNDITEAIEVASLVLHHYDGSVTTFKTPDVLVRQDAHAYVVVGDSRTKANGTGLLPEASPESAAPPESNSTQPAQEAQKKDTISLDDFRNFFSKLDQKDEPAAAEKGGKRRWKASQTRDKVVIKNETAAPTTASVLEEARAHLAAAEFEDPTSGLMTARTADLFKQLKEVAPPPAPKSDSPPDSPLPPIRLSVSITTPSSPDAIAVVIKDPMSWNLKRVAEVYKKHAPDELQHGFEFVWRGVRLPMNESIESLELFGQADSWPCGTMRSVPLLALSKGSGLPMFGQSWASKASPKSSPPEELPSLEEQESMIPDTPKPAAVPLPQPVSAQEWHTVISTPRAAQTWLDNGSIPVVVAATLAAFNGDGDEDDDEEEEESDSDSEAPMLTMSSAPDDDGFTTARVGP